MSFQSHPDYTADSQASVSSQVDDSQDGASCWAIAEKTLWQLSLTDASALGPDVIATRNGVGRWLRIPTASSGGSSSATANLDFTSGPPQETTVVVTVAATWVTATMAFAFSVLDTVSHSAEDSAIEGLTLRVISINPGVSFDLMGVVQDGTNGTYQVVVTGV